MARFEWISENMGAVMGCEETGSGRHLQLSKGFSLGLLASENSSLPYGMCSALERRCLNWCYDRIAIDCAAPVENISVSHFYDGESDGEYGEALVAGGLFRVLRYLALEDPELARPLDIRFNKCVVTVSCQTISSSLYTIACSDGTEYSADVVLCTLPVGVLQSGSVSFDLPCGAIPTQLSNMLQMQSGLMNVAWLWYPEKFWGDNFSFLGLARDDAEGKCTGEGAAWNGNSDTGISTFLVPPMNDQFGRPQPIVLCQLAGDFAEHSEGMDNAQFAEYATSILRRIFTNRIVPDAIGCVHSRWRQDPFSLGSYSVCPHPSSSRSGIIPETNHSQSNTESMRQDEVIIKGLYFAGEAVSCDHPATAHGAFISGEQEACKIIDFLAQS